MRPKKQMFGTVCLWRVASCLVLVVRAYYPQSKFMSSMFEGQAVIKSLQSCSSRYRFKFSLLISPSLADLFDLGIALAFDPFIQNLVKDLITFPVFVCGHARECCGVYAPQCLCGDQRRAFGS